MAEEPEQRAGKQCCGDVADGGFAGQVHIVAHAGLVLGKKEPASASEMSEGRLALNFCKIRSCNQHW
jgi:hypothetical protein